MTAANFMFPAFVTLITACCVTHFSVPISTDRDCWNLLSSIVTVQVCDATRV